MIEHFPPLESNRVEFDAPIIEVTVLEDRAVVKRRGVVELVAGSNRLRVMDVAPVLHDVSLRADSSVGRVSDTRVRRAMRVRRQDRADEVAALEQRIRELSERFDALTERRVRAEERLRGVYDMLGKGAAEVPEDAAWGIVDPESWSQTFTSLFTRGRELQDTALASFHSQQDLQREVGQLGLQRQVLATPSHDFVAWVQIDVVAEEGGSVEITVEYVVPNAMWRPIHRARLVGESLRFTARAAIWQNTGEDWSNVQLVLCTARSSLGTDPPLLRDDLLSAQRRSEEVVVAAREVSVNSASVGGVPSSEVDLPGVDDGGEVQNLRPQGFDTVLSTGAPVFIDVFSFEGPAARSRVAMPELSPRVFVRCVSTHSGPAPVLAGPVELVRDNGTVGWTEVLYVAPGAPFELGFGPDDSLRISRTQRVLKTETDPVDKWKRRQTRLHLYLSNLGDDGCCVELTERVPVSEIEHVKVSLIDDRTTGDPKLDAHGFVTWSVSLEPHERRRLKLGWELATAPDVKGM